VAGPGDDEPGPRKVEGDGRAPAGVFRVGMIYTYDAALPDGAAHPFHQVTGADAWIDDPEHPDYNRHVVVDPERPPAWFEDQRMRLGDSAFRWLVEIRHNADPPLKGAGSAIFLHTRRGPDRPTAGCTAMAEEDLVRIIRWLRAEGDPHFVLLPADEYRRRREAWRLPAMP
jgi:L,D-peptidoglycan transpeptidase YkuD (ErfK/YbiS/YcfS/YnhG family)